MTWHEWNLDDLAELRKQYGTRTNARLSAFFKRTIEEIEAKAAELALGKSNRSFRGLKMPRWTPEDIRILQQLHATQSNNEIAILLGRSIKSVTSKAHNLGLRKDKQRLREMGQANVKTRRDRLG